MSLLDGLPQWRPGDPVPLADREPPSPPPAVDPPWEWVLGVDTGLNRTGLAGVAHRAGEFGAYTWVAAADRSGDDLDDGVDRIVSIREQIAVVLQRMGGTLPLLALIEGPSYGSNASSYFHENAGLWWAVAIELRQAGIPVGKCAPQTRAKWATGNGRAKKPAVIEAMRGMWPDVPCTRIESRKDECDALVLASAAGQYLGWPIPARPSARESLRAMHWPTTPART